MRTWVERAFWPASKHPHITKQRTIQRERGVSQLVDASCRLLKGNILILVLQLLQLLLQQFLEKFSLFRTSCWIRMGGWLKFMKCNQNKICFNSWRWGCFPPDGARGRCYVHMLNAACLSPFSVPCHRYHLTQELFRGQLFQAIESRSKPALCVFVTQCSAPLFFTISPSWLLELRGEANPHRSAALWAANMTSSLQAESSAKQDILTVCVQLFNFYNNILLLILVKCCIWPCGLV